MNRASMSLVAAILFASASVTVDAQDDTVVRVDYVAVVTGERFEVRATSAQRIPAAPDLFAVPDPLP